MPLTALLNLKKRELLLAYLIAALLAVWFVFKVIFAPFHEKLLTLSREAVLSEGRLKKSTGLLEAKDVINREYAKYASFFSLQNVSDEEAVAAFLKEVEKIGRESGVTILDMKPQKESGKDKFSKQYEINIKVEANMAELVKFLYSLHNSRLLFSIDKLVLSPKSEGASDLNVAMTIVGVSFL